MLQKNHHLRKYLSYDSVLGRYVRCVYRMEPDLHVSTPVLFRGICKFYHFMIRQNCCIAAMDLAAAAVEVFLN